MNPNEPKEIWKNKRVRIKSGWFESGKKGIALTEPFYLDQYWIAISWDDEDEPDLFKLSGLEIVL